MHIDLVEVGDPSQLIELIDLPSPFVFEKTTPYLVLRRFSEPLALIIARTWCGRVYARFEIDQKSTEGVPRIGLSSEGTELCSLSEGEWGPWLSVEVDGQSCLLRPHATRVDGEETTLFFTALFRDDGAGISWPPGLAGALQQEGRPYVAEGTGWRIFYEPTVLGSLEEHQRDLGAARLAVAEELLTSAPWDAFVHIFTLTDRVQHPFWKFREPDLYARIPELYPEYASPEPYELHAPSEEAVRDFGGAVDRAYESVDGWLGRVLAHAADSTLIVVVSDHGGQGGPHELSPTAGIHHEDGIYLMVGPTVPPREDGERELSTPMEQTDVVPLVLAHLRLPSARDLPGGVPEDLMPRAADGALLALPEPVETYEIETSGQESAGEIDEAIRDQLRSLGYVK